MEIEKILVTGSSGTIGTRLCERLIELKYKVAGVDKRKNKWKDSVNNITIIGDLQNEETFKKLPKDFDLVIHLAANARVYNLVLEPRLALENLITTFNVLEFCRREGIKNFIFASSRETYGNQGKRVYRESDVRVEACESPYTASKLGGEALVHAYSKCYGIDYVILRFSNVYGMYDDSDRVVPLFFRLAKKNEDLIVYGKEKLLDFTYIDDAIDGIVRVVERFGSVANNTFNIASGEGTSILRIAEVIKKEVGSKSRIVLGENRVGEVLKFVADIKKARKMLGYEPKINIEEGIKMTKEWYGI